MSTPHWIATSFIAASLALVQPAGAQETTRLRAGEHSGYSRIAIDLQALDRWSVKTDGRRLLVRFPGRRIKFDTRQVFPQRRVSRVTSASGSVQDDGTTLTLSLSCDCEAEAYEFTDAMLVIDIRAREVESSRAAPTPPPRPRRSAVKEGDAQPVGRDAASDRGAENDLNTVGASSVSARERDAARRGAASSATDADRAPDVAADVAVAQRALLRQLGRAVDQGLVELRTPTRENDRETQTVAKEPPMAPDPGLVAAVEAEASPEPRADDSVDAAPSSMNQIQIRAATAFDGDEDRIDVAAASPVCPSDDWLRAADWGEDEDFYGQLSEIRATLVQEFDRPSTAAAMDLARLYIRFGFGAEALQVLNKTGAGGGEAAILIDAATVVDSGVASSGGALEGAARCPGATATWRLAAGLQPSSLDLATATWRDAALRAFEELPLLLRRRLAPRAVETLTAMGHPDLAEAFRTRLDRAPGDHGRRWDLAVARLLYAQGEDVRADSLLSRAAASGDDVGAEALLEVAQRQMAQDRALSEDLIERLASASSSRDGTLLGRQLLVAELFGRAGQHQLKEVLGLIALEKETRAGRQEDLDSAMRAILKETFAHEVGQAAYAEAILAHLTSFGTGPTWDSTRIAVAHELTEVGLANVAQDVLAPVIARGGADGRIAAAAAQIALGRPTEALLLLQPLDDGRASRVEAEALAADGRYEAALARLGRIGREEADLAWRAGAWPAAAELGDDARRRDLARWMADGARIGPSPREPGLDATRDALQQSQDLRQRIMEALEDG